MLYNGLAAQLSAFGFLFQVIISVDGNFNPPIFLSSHIGAVICYGFFLSKAGDNHPLAVNAVFRSVAGDRFCPVFREFLIVVFSSLAVGMAGKHHLGVMIVLKDSVKFLNIIFGFRCMWLGA